jgi:hypothetical protein
VSFPGSLLYCHPDTTLYDKVCQRLAAGRRFSPGTPVSSTNKTDCHDITEILLKMALSILNQLNCHLMLILINLIYT